MTGTRGLSRIRALSAQTEPQELQDLREHVQSVNCSNCGAAVDVTGASVCSYCRKSISTTAPGQIRKAIEEAERAEARRHQAEASVALRVLEERAAAERAFADTNDGAWLPRLLRENPGGGLVETTLRALLRRWRG